MKSLVAIGAAILSLTASAVLAEDARTAIYPAGNVPLAPYTPGVQTDNGFLFVSGQIAYVGGAIPDHAKDGVDDVKDQAQIVMEKLEQVLKEAGYGFNDAVRATVFLANIEDYGPFNEIYGTFWGEGDIPPARAAIEVGTLPGGKPGAPVLVEVSMIAYK